jgi:hypothetical protein
LIATAVSRLTKNGFNAIGSVTVPQLHGFCQLLEESGGIPYV